MMAVPEPEGVIKFQYDLTERPLETAVLNDVENLDVWRQILFARNLIGQDPSRYDGAGFGNVSSRISGEYGCFVITASQTGGLSSLEPAKHYTVIDSYDLAQNSVTAHGEAPPSSETPTHAVFYAEEPDVRAVFHGHSPVIWQAAKQKRLSIPTTDPDVAYGTPAMAEEMRRLLKEGKVQEIGILAMLGHQDGVISFGTTLKSAGVVMLGYLLSA